jgi:hypothetical protein
MVHAPLMLMNFGKNMCLNLVVQIIDSLLTFFDNHCGCGNLCMVDCLVASN